MAGGSRRLASSDFLVRSQGLAKVGVQPSICFGSSSMALRKEAMASSSFPVPSGRAEGAVGPVDFRVAFDGLSASSRSPRQGFLGSAGRRRGSSAEGLFGSNSMALRKQAMASSSFSCAAGSCRGCCGPGKIRVAVRWPSESRRWPRPSSLERSGQGPGGVGRGGIRVEFDGLAVAGDGLVPLPLVVSARPSWCGPGQLSGRVRWPCGRRRWPRPTSLVIGQSARSCCGPRRTSGRVRGPCGGR